MTALSQTTSFRSIATAINVRQLVMTLLSAGNAAKSAIPVQPSRGDTGMALAELSHERLDVAHGKKHAQIVRGKRHEAIAGVKRLAPFSEGGVATV